MTRPRFLNLLLLVIALLCRNADAFAGTGAITGNTSICAGSSSALSDTITGGIWVSSNITIATVAGTGVVTGRAPGTVIITYSGPGVFDTVLVTIHALPQRDTLKGGGGYCFGGSGDSVMLTSSATGVFYRLYHNLVPADSLAGTGSFLYFGLKTLPGTYTVIATNVVTGCTSQMQGTDSVYINPLPVQDTVTGGGSYCAGGSGLAIGLDISSTGVSYQLYGAGHHPSGSPVAGTGTAISFGLHTVADTYTVVAINPVTGCSSNSIGRAIISTISVVPSISISSAPGDTVCPGTTVTFSAIPVNGGSAPTYVWEVNSIPIPRYTSTTFSLVPNDSDIVSVTMTSTATCAIPATATAAHAMVVNLMPSITGSTAVCIGGTSALTDAAPGGSWSTATPSIATIATIGGSVGISSGIAAGTAILTYMLGTGCYAVTTLTVLPSPSITASHASTCGDAYMLTAAGGASYSWAPSSGLSCPTCGFTTATLSSSATYTVTGTDAFGCIGTDTVSLGGNRIFGHVTFSSTLPDTLGVKVWLIQYDPADSSIIALDSVTTCTIGNTGYYEFDGKPAGSYMTKAALVQGNKPGASGYMPTYSYAAPYWSSAATISHVSSSDSLPINMVYGIVPSGPGFIGGYVYSGAGKGSSEDTPVAGMMMYLKDLADNSLTYTYTDASGAYSFSKLAYGNYIVYPEQYDYNTISSGFITLNASSESINDITFKQYTTSRIIAPFTKATGVRSVTNTAGINVYPNPSNGVLNIQWHNPQTGAGSIIITDMMGRTVYNATLNINAATANTIIDLKGINDGMYLISIKSDNVSYSARLLLQK